MAFAFRGAGALDYAMCAYGGSRLLLRGPKRDTERAYVSVLGGSEVFGKFVSLPFPELLERQLGMPVVNMGVQNAGVDVFLNDPAIMQIAAQSSVAVVQLFGAHNNSNRFYAVHPRRNDRFVTAKPALQALYPRMDFTEFHFTRHLIQALHHQSPERFEIVAAELRQVWLRRMTDLLAQIRCPTILLWVSDAPAPQKARDLFASPMLIDAGMIAQIAPLGATLVNAIASPEARVMALEGMAFAPADLPAAAASLGPFVHREICDTLHPFVETILAPPKRAI